MTEPISKLDPTDFLPSGVFVFSIAAAALIYHYEPANWANGFSMCLLLIALAIILALHIWTPNLDPLDRFVSEYSLSRAHGNMMRTAFYLIAAATLNSSFLLARAGMGFTLKALVFAAGVFSALMGVFSQKSSVIDDIKNTEFEGNMHSVSSVSSFGLATVSMLAYAYWRPEAVMVTMDWSRAFALALFNVTLVVVIVQIILGLRRIKLAKKQKRSGITALLADDVTRRAAALKTSLSAPQGAVQAHLTPTSEKSNLAAPELQSLVQANKGLGLSERILILLFLEWEFFLCIFCLGRAGP